MKNIITRKTILNGICYDKNSEKNTQKTTTFQNIFNKILI